MAKTKKAKAKAKARHVAPAKAKPKPALQVQKPAVARPFVPAAHAHTTSLPAEIPPADLGSGLSTRWVLLITFMVAVGAGLLAFLAGTGWRRYHSYPVAAARAPGGKLPPVNGSPNGPNTANGSAMDEGESVTVVTHRGADAPTGT